MPKIYTAIKKSCMASGGKENACQSKAAKIYNAMRQQKPSLPKLSNKHKTK